MRLFSSLAALTVNVVAKIAPTGTFSSTTRCSTRSISEKVLPEPALALMNSTLSNALIPHLLHLPTACRKGP